MQSILWYCNDAAFMVYLDDLGMGASNFEAALKFLHEQCFPRLECGPRYLTFHKDRMFSDHVELLGFGRSNQGMRLAEKHTKNAVERPGQ